MRQRNSAAKSGRRKLPGLSVKDGFMRHPFDAKFGVQTSGLVSGRHLKAGHAHDRHNTAYYGVAPSIFRDLCKRWRESPPAFPPDKYNFIDLGAGMGRAVLLGAEMPFREAVGVELNPELALVAAKNIAIWERVGRALCPMRILQQDATEIDFPDGPCVLFLFNPFGATVMRRLLKRIEAAFRERPGELDLLYVNHEQEKVLAQHSGFKAIYRDDILKSPNDEIADREILLNQPEGEYASSEYESCSIYRWVGYRVGSGAGISSATTSKPLTHGRASYNQVRMSSNIKAGNPRVKKLGVGILFGGRSGEHEVSLLSAASILKAIDVEKYEVVPVGITKEGRWVTETAAASLLAGRALPAADETEAARAGKALKASAAAGIQPTALRESLKVDVIFPVLHGTFGEDGTIQGLFELANIAYVGSGVLGSAAGMDKDVMKRLFVSAGLPTPKYLSFLRSEWRSTPKKIVKLVEAKLRYPMFVKPANLGSSVGISKAHDRKELGPAIDLAANFDRKIVIEQGVGGSKKNPRGKARELEVAVLGNDSPEASVVGEIVPGKEFYDYEAKYQSDASVPIIPAKITRSESKRIREMAIAAFRACDCSGLARVDFLMEPEATNKKTGRVKRGRIFVNEVNTLPGFTNISMYPKLWEASGLGYSQLIDRLIELALERRAERDETSFSR
jgi:D-alanine-D-alanine ligase